MKKIKCEGPKWGGFGNKKKVRDWGRKRKGKWWKWVGPKEGKGVENATK